ncbi:MULTISPECIES: DUF4303 domain-containing protein [unclassified Sphingomonas]|jgi:hypothetical protein|uniref:DUF4303 domain-containing protein n=1 Tax=unclassified Sphingomonas TaxID=196159 RepID=UPI000DBBF7F9|nr:MULTISPECIES: DUF4303 domain-containing protein [unclassified Sphingomonas]PZT91400.1 MAG: hypothetical protein DI625_15880 [Sphingomonas sp.]RSV29544.1 DUF4303 domain-containing protein [Sphingomonas sp. ABOLH]
MDWDAIENELIQDVRQAFDHLQILTVHEQLYALCLSVSENGMGIGLNANTDSFLNQKLSEERAIEEITLQDESYFRWSSAEWRFEGVGDEFFQTLNNALTEVLLRGEQQEPSFEKLIDAMIEALRHLRDARGHALKGVTLFVTITDSDEAEAIENRSAADLNAPDVAQAFISRFG